MPSQLIGYLLAESEKYPLLTPEEMADLSRAYQRGEEAREKLPRARSPETVARLRRRIAEGEAAGRRMVNSNIRLVVSRAGRFHRRYHAVRKNQAFDLDDSVQDGFEGLMRAVEDFDPERGRFSTYATWWIDHYIQRGADDSGPTIRIPVHMADRRRQVRKIRDRRQQQGQGTSAADVAQEMGVRERVVTTVDRLPWTVSLEETVEFEDGDEEEKGDFIAGETDVEEKALTNVVAAGLWERLRDLLTPVEYRVLRLRYAQDLKLREVGARFGFTRERARQIEAAAIRKVREEFKEELGPD